MAVRYLLALCTAPAGLYMLALFARDPHHSTFDATNPGSVLMAPSFSSLTAVTTQASIVLTLTAQLLRHKYAGALPLRPKPKTLLHAFVLAEKGGTSSGCCRSRLSAL
jgi:hypothetical protein